MYGSVKGVWISEGCMNLRKVNGSEEGFKKSGGGCRDLGGMSV